MTYPCKHKWSLQLTTASEAQKGWIFALNALCALKTKKKKKGGGREGLVLGLKRSNRFTIMTFPAEAENRQEFPYQPFIYICIKLEEKQQEKKDLSVAKLVNSVMHLSFTFGDMKFKKIHHLQLFFRQYEHIEILLPHNSFARPAIFMTEKP